MSRISELRLPGAASRLLRSLRKRCRFAYAKQPASRLLILMLAVFLPWLPAGAEIIDKLMAVAGSRIITQSDIREERSMRAALGDNPSSENALLQDLVDQVLIDEQTILFPGLEVPEAEIEDQLSRVQDRSGLSLERLRDGIRRRLTRLRFFDLRFRQFITVSDDEIQQYYQTIFVPEARARGLTAIPPLQEVADMVRSNIAAEKLGREVEVWLDTLRGRTTVEFFQ